MPSDTDMATTMLSLRAQLKNGRADLEEAAAKMAEMKALLQQRKEELEKPLPSVEEESEALKKENSELKADVDKLRETLKEITRSTSEELDVLRKKAAELRTPVAAHCERLRVVQSYPDQPNPFAVIKQIHEITKEREKEIIVVNKQKRELEMLLKMKEQWEAQLRDELNKELEEQTAEKDHEILMVSTKCMRERAQLLKEIDNLKRSNENYQRHLVQGHFEDKERKVEKAKDHKDKAPRDHDVTASEVTIERESGERVGLRWVDNNKLDRIEPMSAADRHNLHRYIGRRLLSINGKQVKSGTPIKLDAKETTFVLQFDAPTDSMRSSTWKTSEDDPFNKFEKKRQEAKEQYKEMDSQLTTLKEKVKDEKKAVERQIRAIREHEIKRKTETSDLEREVKRLSQKLSTQKVKQAEYELENQKLFYNMEIMEKNLLILRGEMREQREQSESPKRITAGPTRR